MIANIPYTTPIQGTIRLGHIEVRNGKRIPVKDDHMTVTDLFKNPDGTWALHPLHDQLVKPRGKSAKAKLTSIPVRVLYQNPNLNSSARHEAYDVDLGQVVCVGDGARAKRRDALGRFSDVECPGSLNCEFGRRLGCSIMSRTLVSIDGQEDPLAGFIVRSTSYNTATTLTSKLTALSALFGERLPYVPLRLVLRTKTSPLSYNQPFYYLDLVTRGKDLDEVTKTAAAACDQAKKLGLNFELYEQEMVRLLGNGGFENLDESFDEREEFVSERTASFPGDGASMVPASGVTPIGAKEVEITIPGVRGSKGRLHAPGVYLQHSDAPVAEKDVPLTKPSPIPANDLASASVPVISVKSAAVCSADGVLSKKYGIPI